VPRLGSVLETALYVAALEPARRFYEEVMQLPVLVADERLCALDVGGRSVLLLFKSGTTSETVHLPGGTIPPHEGAGRLHMAFAIGSEELATWERHLANHGVAIEGRTAWPRGGHSIYFRDPDAHLIELATPGIWATY
jgi:catechol-2,3-dioxygenase